MYVLSLSDCRPVVPSLRGGTSPVPRAYRHLALAGRLRPWPQAPSFDCKDLSHIVTQSERAAEFPFAISGLRVPCHPRSRFVVPVVACPAATAEGGSRADEKASSFSSVYLFVVVVLVLETAHDGHVAHHERSFLHALTLHHLRLVVFERATVR